MPHPAASGDATPRDFRAAPLDRSTKFLTAAVIAALLGLALSIPAAEAGSAGVVAGWVVPAIIIVATYGYAPKGYLMSPDGHLRIQRRWFGGRGFRIDSAHTTSAVFGLGGVRLAGSGGVFGWYGLFWRSGVGRYRAYVTDRSQLVACDGPDGLVLVSPADRDAFLAAAPHV